MITGTEGPDNLSTNHNPEIIDALGGDDVITVRIDYSNTSGTAVTVYGGAGFDILYVNGAGSVSPTGAQNEIYIRNSSSAQGTVSWTGIERFVLNTASSSQFSQVYGSQTMELSAAEDWINFNNNGNVPLRINTYGGADRVVLAGMQIGGTINLGDGDDLFDASASAPTKNGVFTVHGEAGNDRLIGSSYREELYGGDGNDELDGKGSVASQQPDLLVGGLGNDEYYAYGRETIVENAGEGYDTIYSAVTYGLAIGLSVEQLATINWRNTDPLTLVGNELNNSIIGNNGHNALYGGEGGDTLRGLAGNDVMDGQSGTDYLIGGVGDDIYYVDGLDTAEELAGEGYDVVYANTHYVLNTSSEIEMLATTDYTSTAALSLSGNQLNNYIVGNNGDNVLDGRAGDDSMRGLAGNDQMIGGTGTDYMLGGTGDDTYYADTGDIVEELSGEGYDSVYASTTYVLTAGSSVELIGTQDSQSNAALDLTGNDLNQSVVGSNGANVLMGLGGSDSIDGVGGNDRIDGGAGQDYLTGGGGGDVFVFSAASHSALGAADTIADFTSGSDRIDLTGIDANSATAGDDAFTFIGSGAFTGQAGELRVEGGAGTWQIYGDVNGDSVADFQIIVYGSAPVSGDFNF